MIVVGRFGCLVVFGGLDVWWWLVMWVRVVDGGWWVGVGVDWGYGWGI